MAHGRLVPLLVVGLACGNGGSAKPQPMSRGDATGAEIGPATAAPLVLGMPEVSAYAYRTRAGHPAFKRAREAESSGNWAAVAASCREALVLDPAHLDAAYLLAVALAKTDAAAAEIIAPLSIAVAGDFTKWGAAALEQPALQTVLASPLGVAWRARVDEARQQLTGALARSLLVTAGGDVYAYDGDAARWYRLTRTSGAVIGSMHVRSAHQLAYVTRTKREQGIGLVDLAQGRTRRPLALPDGAVRVAYNTRIGAFVVRMGKMWSALADDGKLALRAVDAKERAGHVSKLADMAWLDVNNRSVRLDRLGLANVVAEWDEHTLASALKIASSHRVVSAPSRGLIDGNTAAWSPDRAQLAFVAQLDDTCAPGKPTMAVYVADAATGATHELERAITGIALEWSADRRLAVAGDRGVSVYELPARTATPIAGADGLAMPRRRPRCAAEPPPSDVVVPDDLDEADPADSGAIR